MTTSNSASSSASISFPVFGLAFAVLLVLKVAGLAGASWGLASLSWFWVFFPLLLGFGLFLFVIAIVLLVAVFASR